MVWYRLAMEWSRGVPVVRYQAEEKGEGETQGWTGYFQLSSPRKCMFGTCALKSTNKLLPLQSRFNELLILHRRFAQASHTLCYNIVLYERCVCSPHQSIASTYQGIHSNSLLFKFRYFLCDIAQHLNPS